MIRGDEAAQGAAAQAAVGVGDGLQRQVVDARLGAVGRGRRIGQARQLVAVAVREVAPRGADLLVDQVHVVQQPFGRRRDRAVVGDGLAQAPRDALERALVGRQPGEQPIWLVAPGDTMACGQQLAVRHHLVAAEQRRAQRLFFLVFARRPGHPGALASPFARPDEQGVEGAVESRHRLFLGPEGTARSRRAIGEPGTAAVGVHLTRQAARQRSKSA
jgi:hypothetical protein